MTERECEIEQERLLKLFEEGETDEGVSIDDDDEIIAGANYVICAYCTYKNTPVEINRSQ